MRATDNQLVQRLKTKVDPDAFALAVTRYADLVVNRQVSRRLPFDIQRTARRKLLQMHAATQLQDLTVPPGKRLEPLKRRRAGQHSIRVNNHWRICFRWESGAHEVEIVDYH